MARAITVVSGKKGVGSSTVAINLAICIAVQGYRTCLLLTDPQFYENTLPMGMAPEKTLTAVIEKKLALADVIIDRYHGIDILLGGSMLKTAQSLDSEQMQYILHSFETMPEYDFFIIDAFPGNSKPTLSLCLAATDILLVLTPESPSITSAHSLVRTLGQNGFSGSMSVVVNQSKNVLISGMAINKLNDSLQKSFRIHLESVGDITKDPQVSKSTGDPTPHVVKFPESTVSRDIQKIALTLTNMETSKPPIAGPAMFWERFFHLLNADSKDVTALMASSASESHPSGFAPDEKEPPSPDLKIPLAKAHQDAGDFKQAVSAGDFQTLLERLSDSIALLSREVGDLRIMLEHQSRRRLSDSSDSPVRIPSKVSLDFESFLSQRME